MFTIPQGFTLYINIAVVVFYLIFLILGSRRGVLRQIIAVAGLLISGFLAVRYYVLLASYIHIVPTEWLPLQDTMIADMIAGYANEAVWFLILFLVFRLLFTFIDRLAAKIHELPVLKQISSILGAGLGVITATIWIFVICTVMSTSLFSNGDYYVRHTALGMIRTAVTGTLKEQNLPVSTTDIVNQIYMTSQNISDDDKKAIEEWLQEQGFEPQEHMQLPLPKEDKEEKK
ncbi:MAG: CvpA family protein [Solobacterium sp.]|nr:CvpA family protein [Solobacterium sp.]